MKKKILLALAAAGTVFLFSGCGGSGGAGGGGGSSLPESKPRTDTPAAMTVKYGDRTAYFYEYKDVDLSAAKGQHFRPGLVKQGESLYFVMRDPDAERLDFALYEVKIQKETGKDCKKLVTIAGAEPVYGDGKNVYFSEKYQENGKNKYILSYYDGTAVKRGPNPEDTGERTRWYAGKDGYLYELVYGGKDSFVNLVKAENGTFKQEKKELLSATALNKDIYTYDIRADAQGIYAGGILLKDGKEATNEQGKKMAAMSIFDTQGKLQRTLSPGYMNGARTAVSDHFVVFANSYYTKQDNKKLYEYTIYDKSNGKELGRFGLEFLTYAMVGADGDSIYLIGNQKLYRMDL